ncbi:hypothetical protein [Pedobacter sp. UC225_65]|uniref:hypothetical protein n=1 Tax=Pedobacter sp. UC225_65 TaxID=3350173 RepID=UPI0036707051
MNYKQLQEEVKEHVLEYFHTHHDAKLVYHNLEHTQSVVDATIQIANHYQLSDKDFFIVSTGAWFHDTGYFEDAQNHETKGANLADAFLKEKKVSAEIRDAVIQVISLPKCRRNQQIYWRIFCAMVISFIWEPQSLKTSEN